MNITVRNVFCRRIEVGGRGKSNLYETTFHLGEQSDVYSKLSSILKEQDAGIDYIGSHSTISNMVEVLYTEGDAAIVNLPGQTATLEEALEYGSTFTAYVDVYLAGVTVNIKEINEKQVGEVAVARARTKVTGNLTLRTA